MREQNPISEEDAKAKEHAEMLKPLPNTDCPETLDLHDPMDAEVWKVFNDMRIAKVRLAQCGVRPCLHPAAGADSIGN